ncbi:hypothetical protein FA95DRAFT_1559167 [Auriscalpium vulgare]|uniref:Uncharacterized protein n=1 Tax=Auriscalpium vulgare TaxID=40419 RepID=A0ACB8RUY2_9AGAM|nr:hypothetical protein FA95DRAFT_1559167 [Auriscalpium vulgare]
MGVVEGEDVAAEEVADVSTEEKLETNRKRATKKKPAAEEQPAVNARFCKEEHCTDRGPFRALYELTRHKFYKHGKGVQCQECHQILSQPDSRTRHMRDIHKTPELIESHAVRSKILARNKSRKQGMLPMTMG